MEWVEVTGRSVEEAKESALDALGVAEEDAEFEVLAEGRSGLFGLVRSEARLRARVRPARPRSKDERRERSRRQGRRAAPGADRSRGRTRASGGSNGSVERGEAPVHVPTSPSRAGTSAPDNGASSEEGLVVRELSFEEQAGLAQEFLEELVDRFQLDAEVDRRTGEDESIELSVTGPDLGLLIGHGGSTLSAIQELTRTVVQRRSGGRTARVFVDVAGYKEKRREALTRFARRVAEDVLASGEEEALEPMSPSDRKVIHDAVNEIEGVGTRSEGEEPRRWIVIFPAR